MLSLNSKMALLSRALKAELIEVASKFGISVTSEMRKIERKDLILTNSAYTENDAKGVLEAIRE